MNSDREAIELISRSLSGELSAEERTRLRSYQSEHEGARILHQWMAAIEHAAEVGAEQTMEDNAAGMSQLSKERLKRLLREREEARRSASTSTASSMPANAAAEALGRVAELETTYYTGYATGATEKAEGDGEQPHESRRCDGRFTLLQEIGRGGLGTVYLARDEVLGRKVALKEMNPAAAKSPRLWRRFYREAQITGHLEHPHVVPVYASGTDPQTGLPFYAMRFLGKQTLADAIREYHARREAGVASKLDLHRLLNGFLDVCEAIAYAHQRGVLHRDLKPENVALDRFGQVVVLDWGLAKLEADGELLARLALSGEDIEVLADDRTLQGDYLGTPLYMAPEQAAGDLDAVDVRTDVYGLGAILYTVLTGRAPHHQTVTADQMRSDVRQVMQSIVSTPPPPPRQINAQVSRDLEAICLRALSVEKAARQRSAVELAAEVEAWIAGRKERASNYEAVRMAGHDLKSRLCVQSRQLGATTRFLTELPPVQELLVAFDRGDPTPSEDASAGNNQQRLRAQDVASPLPMHLIENGWEQHRQRVAAILMAAIRNRPSLASVRFVLCEKEHVRELIHVRRGKLDHGNIRPLPPSQLYYGVPGTFHQDVLAQFPGEPYLQLADSPVFAAVLQCGVAVVDERNEEVRGMIIAEAELRSIAGAETERLQYNATIHLFDLDGHLLYSTGSREVPDEQMASMIEQRWEDISSQLEESSEFLDPAERIYATRLVFPNQNSGITIVVSNQR